MLFNSLNFVVFFLVVYGVYLLLPHKGQNLLLLTASYVFYGTWNYRFLALLLLSTLVDFVLAQCIASSPTQRRRRFYLVLSMVVSLAVLGFFKYFNFFASSLADLLGSLGWRVESWQLKVILPWGISFYTFQTMNYTIDVYRGHMKPTRDFVTFATFVSFFPHLVAGPIMRASALLPQVERPRSITRAQIEEGAWLVLWGLFKKAVIADNLAAVVDSAFSGGYTAGSVLVGVYAFAYQIYCDFSGYSDMARGISKLMGFELMVNFRNPYFATNPSEFWRRWHISLSTWLRDYLYIPLGGNRKGPGRTYVNLLLTMLLGGLWHGAAWTFVAWGFLHGVMLALHRLVRGESSGEVMPSPFGRLWRRVLLFHAVCLGWLLFRASSFQQAMDMLAALVTVPAMGTTPLCWLLALVVLALPLWAVQLLEERTGDEFAPMRLSLFPRAALFATCLLMLLFFGNTGGHAFIYFQF